VAFPIVRFVLKPVCYLLKMLYLIQWSISLLCIIFSKIFEKDVRSDTDLSLDTSYLLPFVYNGFIIEYFNLSGSMPIERVLLHI